MVQPSASIKIFPRLLASFADAKGALGSKLLAAKLLPDGFQISGIAHFYNEAPRADNLIVTLTNPGRYYIKFYQGEPVLYDGGAPYRVAPQGKKGQITVQGQPAVWFYGTARRQGGWDDGALSLGWRPSVYQNSTSLGLGCVLESNLLDLVQLAAIAESVSIY